MEELTINVPGTRLLRLREEHIEAIVELMNKEGWYYYDHHELKRYLNLNQDCFTLLEDERVVGSIFTTNYGNQAWIGNIIVAQEARGTGRGAGMIRAVIDYLRENKDILTFRLGAVPLAIGLYKKMGFHAEAFTTSQEAKLPLKIDDEEIRLSENIKVDRLKADDLEAIAEIDERYFRSERSQILTSIYNDSNKESCFCLKDQGKVGGFLMLRRRQASKDEGGFGEGPDYAYRLGPSCVLPTYGINGFKALFQKAIRTVNEEVRLQGRSARIYVVFPKNAGKKEIYGETRELAAAMGMDGNLKLDEVFDEHNLIFGAQKSTKNEEQWRYMESLGFHQEYFEQVMFYTVGEALETPPAPEEAERTRADPEGIFASATPGDKA